MRFESENDALVTTIAYRCDRCGRPRLVASAPPPSETRCGDEDCNGPLREIELEMDDR